MNITKLSIIIPAFNESRTIYSILDRIRDVNLVNGIAKEIIIVNDCSTDDTEKAAETFIAENPSLQVVYFKHEINKGKGAAIRTGGSPPRDVVAYIGRAEGAEGERPARLWLEGQGARRLSQEAGGASNVALVSVGASELRVLTLDARMGMSSVHAARLQYAGDGAPQLGEDRVVFVGGSAQWSTPMVALVPGGQPVALLPMGKEATGFGLLSLLVADGAAEATPSWIDYPNGLDPAPLAAAEVCGAARVAFVRPERAEPGAAQQLELADVGADGRVTALRTMASAPRIAFVALFGVPAAGHAPEASAHPDVASPQSSAASRTPKPSAPPKSGAKPGASATRPAGASDAPPAGWLAYATDSGLKALPLRCDR